MTTCIPSVGQKRNLLGVTRILNLELPFICQIDEQIHSASESAYWCDRCDIYECGGCYTVLATMVGLTVCHHCHGTLTTVLGLV